MESEPKLKPVEHGVHPAKAAEHVASAHRLLTALHKATDWPQKHPELQEAILELEKAMYVLTVKTNAML